MDSPHRFLPWSLRTRFAHVAVAIARMLLVGLIARPLFAHGGTASIAPRQDNTLFEDTEGDTSNGSGPALFAGNNGQNRVRRAVIRFDVASVVPTGATIDSVALTLQIASAPDTTTRFVTLQRLLADWGEGGSSSAGGAGAPAMAGDATWIHTFYPDRTWAAAGGDFDAEESARAALGETGAAVWTGAAMAADVQRWLDHPETNFGWILRGDETNPRTVRRFESRESAILSLRPSLMIFHSQTVPTRTVSWGAAKARFR